MVQNDKDASKINAYKYMTLKHMLAVLPSMLAADPIISSGG